MKSNSKFNFLFYYLINDVKSSILNSFGVSIKSSISCFMKTLAGIVVGFLVAKLSKFAETL